MRFFGSEIHYYENQTNDTLRRWSIEQFVFGGIAFIAVFICMICRITEFSFSVFTVQRIVGIVFLVLAYIRYQSFQYEYLRTLKRLSIVLIFFMILYAFQLVFGVFLTGTLAILSLNFMALTFIAISFFEGVGALRLIPYRRGYILFALALITGCAGLFLLTLFFFPSLSLTHVDAAILSTFALALRRIVSASQSKSTLQKRRI